VIHTIEAKNYRSIKYIRQSLEDFQVLVGANASGKTTFLDVISFVADLVRLGIDEAVAKRTSNFQDLTFCSLGGFIEFAIECVLPDSVREKFTDYAYIRYEIRIGLDKETNEHAIFEESAFLLKENACVENKYHQRIMFPISIEAPETILNKKYKSKSFRRLFRKNPGGNDNFYDETQEKSGKGWMPSFKFGPKKTALGNLPADATKFPSSVWLKELLTDHIQVFMLDSLKIRNPSPPGQSRRFRSDGSNLPWVIGDLKKNKDQFESWIEHVRTALPDIMDIDVIERPEDRHKYLKIVYTNGAKVPSWLVSDGTLRLLALTIVAYLSDFKGVYLIEEPENGIHPKAIETVYQSLSSVYDAQILLASHSPIILSMVEPKDLLCFAKTEQGETDIVSGSRHPRLTEWKGDVSLSVLFAGGILG